MIGALELHCENSKEIEIGDSNEHVGRLDDT